MSGLSGLTYIELAARYDVGICDGWCTQPGHEKGFVTNDFWIHWRPDRRVTRSGLRRFLMLVAELRQQAIRLSDPPTLPKYRRFKAAQALARRNLFAYRTALNDLGIRLPRSLSAKDRALVLHLLTDNTGGDPAVKALRNWARES